MEDENKITITFVAVDAQDTEDGCHGCVFDSFEGCTANVCAARCSPCNRKDHRNIVWKEEKGGAR